MKYLLDTNIVRAVMDDDPRIDGRFAGIRSIDIGLPQPVLAEVAAGLARMPRSKRREAMRADFERIRREFPRSAWSDSVSDAFGEIRAALEARGGIIEDFDIAIAAHALVEGAILVTANTRHFERIDGLELENWLDTH